MLGAVPAQAEDGILLTGLAVKSSADGPVGLLHIYTV